MAACHYASAQRVKTGKHLTADCQGEEEGEGVVDEGETGLSGSFRPGKVVWAKVDGYQWWPAKVNKS